MKLEQLNKISKNIAQTCYTTKRLEIIWKTSIVRCQMLVKSLQFQMKLKLIMKVLHSLVWKMHQRQLTTIKNKWNICILRP